MPIPHLKEPNFRIKKIGAKISQFKMPKVNQSSNSRTLRGKWAKLKWLKKNSVIILIGLIIFGVISGIGVFAYFSKDLPDPGNLLERQVAESTKIYTRDGKTLLYEIHGDEKRTLINIEDIPLVMQQATIAIEDQNFYSHSGFDLGGIFKAVCHEVVGNLGGLCPQRGGSTITQQFVKNAILTNEQSYTRKIKELVLSYQLEKKFTKDQILQMYFNEIPFGSTLYGVEAAAQTFLGKSVRDVTLSEAAFLAAIPQRPTYLSPYGNHIDELSTRLHTVLNQMVKMGFITEEQSEEAKKDNIAERLSPQYENITAPHFVFYVREQLSERYGEKVIEQGGLSVITTLDIDKQRIAEEVLTTQAEKNRINYNANNAALVSIDTKTGQILAMVGSKDYFDETIDGNVNVALSPRQPGSSFKPMVYLTAFSMGYTPETILFDLVTKFKTDGADYEPKNYDLVEHGPVSMREALAGSLNIPAVKTLYLAGIDNVLDTAEKFGYSTFGDRSRFGLSLVLGGGELTLLDHTSAFATFAREGIRHPVSSILKVEDNSGKILEEFEEREEEVFDTDSVRILNNILSDDGARAYVFGAGGYLTLPGRSVAAKTGTTNDYRDAWTIGYTPSIATGVWVGNNDNSEMRRGAAGAVVAAPIWNAYMRQAVVGPAETFKTPKENNSTKDILQGRLEGETSLKVDTITGHIIPAECLDTYPKQFIEEKIFRVVHNILHYINRENPTGPAPTDPTVDPQYQRWEDPVQRWAKENNYLDTKPPMGNCNFRSAELQPIITITSPIKGATINSPSLAVTVNTSIPTTSNYKITKVEYYIDNVLVGTITTPPYSLSYVITELETGFHDLKAVVYDEISNFGSDHVSINYLTAGRPTNTNSN
ncbi:MAG: penicillin-binding protein [bacterium]|nr:penicillin-binding protein [bacterium]